jgi:multidrug efflux pump subunit AcrA (membrane-fusion protein)
VTTGRRGDGWIEIVSGVKAGDTVALEPAGLRTGQAVRVSSPAAVATPSASGARL